MKGQDAASGRYALALYRAAEAADQTDKVGGDLKDLCAVMRPSGLLRYLDNPRFAYGHNVRVIERLKPLFASPLTAGLLRVLLRKGRIGIIFSVSEGFSALVREARGVVSAEAVLAGTPNEALKKKLLASLKKMTGKQVELTIRTDPGVVGGIFIKIGNRVIDGSIRSRLDELKKSLLETEIN